MNEATPQRLYLMQLMRATVVFEPDKPVEMVVVCYLVTMSDGKQVLIDSGLPADAAMPPGTPPPDEVKDVFAQLAELGLRPEEIDVVICTHFDPDHAGNHDAFVKAEFVVQRRHYEVAKAGEPRYLNVRDHWDQPGLKYRLVEGDVELFPGLKLIESSGHAPGHQSVLVTLPETGKVLLAIDAVAQEHDFSPDRAGSPRDVDAAQAIASTQKLLDLVAQENVTLTVFGHDGEHWRTLKRAPDFYA